MKKYEVTLSSPHGAIAYMVDACDSDRAIARARKRLAKDVGDHNARKYRHSIAEEMEKDENG
jgi:hypothetical protein